MANYSYSFTSRLCFSSLSRKQPPFQVAWKVALSKTRKVHLLWWSLHVMKEESKNSTNSFPLILWCSINFMTIQNGTPLLLNLVSKAVLILNFLVHSFYAFVFIAIIPLFHHVFIQCNHKFRGVMGTHKKRDL